MLIYSTYKIFLCEKALLNNSCQEKFFFFWRINLSWWLCKLYVTQNDFKEILSIFVNLKKLWNPVSKNQEETRTT